MKGKHWSIPTDMVFKKSYCFKCGVKLIKEKTHRVVNKDDPDYYRYHEVGHYPKHDYDVYSYRYVCPGCNNRTTDKEQGIIRRIQKKCKSKILSNSEMDFHYEYAKKKENRNRNALDIIVPNIMILIVYVILYFFGNFKENWEYYLIMFVLFEIFVIIGIIRNHKGKHRLLRKPAYTYERKDLLEKLHTRASNNKELIMNANKVYCFHCKKEMSYKDIVEYIDNDSTGICPYCGVDSLLPDSMDELKDEEIINDMNRYWF